MKSIEILATGIRLVGIYLVILGFRTAVFQYQTVQSSVISLNYGPVILYAGIAEVALIFFAAVVMIKFPLTLSRWLLAKPSGNDVALDGSARDIQTALFVVLGVYILSKSIPDFFWNGVWWVYSYQGEIFTGQEQFRFALNEIVTVIEMGIGLYLCIGASGLGKLLWRLRNVGIS